MKTLLLAAAALLVASGAQAMCGGAANTAGGMMCGMPAAEAQSGHSIPGMSMPMAAPRKVGRRRRRAA